MVQTYIIYFGLAVLCWLLAGIAEQRQKVCWLWLLAAVISLVAGLRGYSVGLDTQNYVDKFSFISKGQLQYAYGFETGFKCFCYVLSRLSDNGTVFLTVLAAITNICVIIRMWDFRRISSLRCMVTCYYMCFFFMSLNGARQFCAVAVVFFFTRYLERHKVLLFFAGLFIAVLFHSSAVVGAVFLIFEMLHWSRLPGTERVFLVSVLCISPIVFVLALPSLAHYVRYFSSVHFSIGLMIPVKLFFFLLTVVFVCQARMRCTTCFSVDIYLSLTIICAAYALGIVLSSLGYIFPFLDRISWYFYIFEGAYFGMLFKDEEPINRFCFGGAAVLLTGYTFIHSILYNSQGTVPYIFFWQ